MKKPTFLDCPPRYTRTPRTHQSGADYGSPIERSRHGGGFADALFAVALGLVLAALLVSGLSA